MDEITATDREYVGHQHAPNVQFARFGNQRLLEFCGSPHGAIWFSSRSLAIVLPIRATPSDHHLYFDQEQSRLQFIDWRHQLVCVRGLLSHSSLAELVHWFETEASQVDGDGSSVAIVQKWAQIVYIVRARAI